MATVHMDTSVATACACLVLPGCVQELDPALVLFLLRLGCLPASLALPWLCCGFVGVVSVEEVLLLWDRVVGMDSLLPLPLLAVAVLCFRRVCQHACHVACGKALVSLAACSVTWYAFTYIQCRVHECTSRLNECNC